MAHLTRGATPAKAGPGIKPEPSLTDKVKGSFAGKVTKGLHCRRAAAREPPEDLPASKKAISVFERLFTDRRVGDLAGQPFRLLGSEPAVLRVRHLSTSTLKAGAAMAHQAAG